MPTFKLMTACVLALTLSGCASATFKPYTKYDTTTAGIRIPERKPLVVLMGNTVSVQWVCNPDRGQALQFSSFLAKHHMVVDFDGCGGITKLDSDQDSTAVPLALVQIIEKAAENAFKSGSTTSGTSGAVNDGKLAFQMFDVRFDYDGNITLEPLIKPADVLQINTGTGKVSGNVPATAGSTPAIPGVG